MNSKMKFAIPYPGALSHAESNQGLKDLRNVQTSKNVVIEQDESKCPTYLQVAPSQERFVLAGKIEVIVQQGRVYRQAADVIVCPAEENLELCGEVGEKIMQEGGKTIEDECTAQVKSHGNVMCGHLYISKQGNLSNCKHIFHAVGPKAINPNSANIMNALLKEIITKAHELKVTKIALPLAFNCPADLLTEELLSVVSGFVRQTPGTTLREICVVDMNALRLYRSVNKLKELAQQATLTTAASGASAASANVTRKTRPFVYDENSKTLTTEEGITVELFKGSICKVEPAVEVILNSTRSDLALNNGTLSSAIYQMAGASIQDEVNKKAPDGIRADGETVASEGHNIRCATCVYHCALVEWDGDKNGNSVKVLRNAVKEALTLADNQRHRSIAIPAIGSGVLKIPLNIVVDSLFKEVNSFSQKHPRSSVRRVVLVAYDKDKKAVEKFTAKFAQLERNARWSKLTFSPHCYELVLTLQLLPNASLEGAEEDLINIFSEAVTTDQIERSSAPSLDKINDDKAKALQCLQFTHRVKITLKEASNKLDSVQIEGYKDDVIQAKKDALEILSM